MKLLRPGSHKVVWNHETTKNYWAFYDDLHIRYNQTGLSSQPLTNLTKV